MVNAVQTWNGQQILAQNAQYSQEEAQAKLNTQEINDQSQLIKGLKQLPQTMGALEQLESIQSLALRNGRLDAAEKASTMIGQLSARTEATAQKAEQAYKIQEETAQKARDDILDHMSSSTDQASWEMNRALMMAAHPKEAQGMFSLLSRDFDPAMLKNLAEGRMTPAQRVKAQQEQAAAEEQKSRQALIDQEVKNAKLKGPIEAAKEAAQTSEAWATASLRVAQKAREEALMTQETRAGGTKVGKLDTPSNVEVKQAADQLKRLGFSLPSSDLNAAAGDMAAHARSLQLNSPGGKLTWEDAMRQSVQEFKGQFMTEKNTFSKDKTTYVPRPAGVPSNYQAVPDKPTKDEIAAGIPANAQIWVDPKTQQRKWSTE